MKPPSRALIPLAIITLIGAALRFYHLDSGLPDVVYVDAFKFVDAARAMAASGSWAPRDYQYPGLYANLLALLYALGGARSVYTTHLLALAVSALFGAGLIPLAWLAARQCCSPRGALLAAALTACSAVLVTLSRIPATDSLLACFMTAGVWMLAREKVAPRHLLAFGVFLGLAVGTKFTGLFLGPFMLLAIAIAFLRARAMTVPWPALALSGLLALLALIVTTPWIIPRFTQYYDRFALELLIQRHGQIGRVQLGFLDYLGSSTPTWEQPWLATSILYNDGPLVLLFGLLGGLAALRLKFGFPAFLHGLYVILYLALISRPGHLKAVRFLAPILPSFYILTTWILEHWTLHLPKKPQKLLWAAAALLLLAVPVFKSFRYVSMTRREMTNHQVARWIRANLPKDAAMLVSPLFLDNLAGVSANIAHLPQAGARQYRNSGVPGVNAEETPIYYPELIDELRALGVQYLVTNSYFDDAYSDIPENRRWFPRATAAYKLYRERLAGQARLLYETSGLSARRLGPDVRVYILNPPAK